jgi:hypothetical protein
MPEETVCRFALVGIGRLVFNSFLTLSTNASGVQIAAPSPPIGFWFFDLNQEDFVQGISSLVLKLELNPTDWTCKKLRSG